MLKFSHTRRAVEPALLAVGLLLLGYGAGHEIVYALLGLTGDAAAREVHGYLPSFGIAAALLSVVGFALLLRIFLRDVSGPIAHGRTALLVAGLTPAIGFAGGELVELALAPERFADPLLLIGVGSPLQAAIGLLMLLVARLGQRGAEVLARFVAARRAERNSATTLLAARSAHELHLPAASPLAALRAWRAPPLASP